MADSEQELLSDKERADCCLRSLVKRHSCDECQVNTAKAQVTKLKAMGYEQVWEDCYNCYGAKKYKSSIDGKEYDCPTCKGTGKLTKYVKWDREKVADWFYKLYKEAFGDFTRDCELTKQGYLERADQLKEILTGGNDDR